MRNFLYSRQACHSYGHDKIILTLSRLLCLGPVSWPNLVLVAGACAVNAVSVAQHNARCVEEKEAQAKKCREDLERRRGRLESAQDDEEIRRVLK